MDKVVCLVTESDPHWEDVEVHSEGCCILRLEVMVGMTDVIQDGDYERFITGTECEGLRAQRRDARALLDRAGKSVCLAMGWRIENVPD